MPRPDIVTLERSESPLINLGDEYDGRLISYRGKFPECLRALRQKNLEILTQREDAMIMIHQGDQFLPQQVIHGEGIVFYPDGNVVITDPAHNPLLMYPDRALTMKEFSDEFYLDGSLASLAEELRDIAKDDFDDAIQSGAFLWKRKRRANWTYSVDEFFRGEKSAHFLFQDYTDRVYAMLKSMEKDHRLDSILDGAPSREYATKPGQKPFVRPRIIYFKDKKLHLDNRISVDFSMCRVVGLQRIEKIPPAVLTELQSTVERYGTHFQQGVPVDLNGKKYSLSLTLTEQPEKK
ncbi:MAG: hypothetical protein V1743_07245 [Nanoarchaeota archaeon]